MERVRCVVMALVLGAVGCSGSSDDADGGDAGGDAGGQPGDVRTDSASDDVAGGDGGVQDAPPDVTPQDVPADTTDDQPADGANDAKGDGAPDTSACKSIGMTCTPANPCRHGAFACVDGKDVCTETNPMPDGTSCGAAGEYCGGGACKPLTSCGGQGVCFDWPLDGQNGPDWIVQNHVDLDPTSGTKDHSGAIGAAAKTENNHPGIDIHIGSFRGMDKGVTVRAVAPGHVISVADSFDDRNLLIPDGCKLLENTIVVEHANGWRTYYLHLRKNSALVAPGAFVDAGTAIAQVGSSGCSTHPHLHLETHDAGNAVVDPFTLGVWNAPPSYDVEFSYMDSSLRNGSIDNPQQIQDPPPDPTTVAPSATIGLGLILAGGASGDTVKIVYVRPDGSTFKETSLVLSQTYRQSLWSWNRAISTLVGRWKVQILLNGALVREHAFDVAP